MGYTHYWRMTDADPLRWAAALEAACEIVRASHVPLGDWEGNGSPEADPFEGINFNGVGGDGHESFCLPSPTETKPDFAFCKTAGKPYDVIVTAVLAAVESIAPECISVTSDGTWTDWEEGVMLASKVLGRSIPTPKGVEQ